MSTDLPYTEAHLCALLDDLGVAFKMYRHAPQFTVEQSQELRGDMPGAHVKNMFLKDKSDRLWLVTCLEDRQIRIRDLEKTLGARKMSFGKPDRMMAAIGVAPGAVTPLAVVNDRAAQAVTVVMDEALRGVDAVCCHPLHNEATIAMSGDDLVRVLDAVDHPPLWADFDALEAAAAAAAV